MYYKAQANVVFGESIIYKDQAISKDVFDKLNERQKTKFVAHSEESDVNPKGFGEIVDYNLFTSKTRG